MRRNIEFVEVLDKVGRRIGTVGREEAIDMVTCRFARAIRGKQIQLTDKLVKLRGLSATPGTALSGSYVDKWKDPHPGRRKALHKQPATSGFFSAQKQAAMEAATQMKRPAANGPSTKERN